MFEELDEKLRKIDELENKLHKLITLLGERQILQKCDECKGEGKVDSPYRTLKGYGPSKIPCPAYCDNGYILE